MKRKFYIAVVCACLISSCAVGPDYKRPELKLPSQHRGALSEEDKVSLADLPWWEIFKDADLKLLIEEALLNNYDLRIASARVEEVRELARIKRGDYYPQVNYSAMDNYGRNVPSYALPAGTHSNAFTGNIQMQWELDVWGRVRRGSESARAKYFASIEAKRDITLILISELAKAYFELLELDKELEIAKRTRQSFSDTYKMFTRRYKKGVSSLLESSRAGASLSQTAANIPDIEVRIFEKENQINFLLGRNPGPIPRATGLAEQYLVPKTPAGIPSTLLERRPDIRKAEQLLVSANAEIGLAKANFFPQFSLTGLLGTSSSDLKTFSSSWALGGSLMGPLFEGGKISANYQASKYAYEQVKAEYEKTVTNAFREVADALMLQEKLIEEKKQQERAVKFLQKATKLSSHRYSKGLSNYIEVLDAQQQLLSAEYNLARTERDRLLAIVQVFKALGGGWDNPSSALVEAKKEKN
jgi:outer membrane protein, multidrug efflux system